MEVPFELDDLVAAGGAAGQPQGVHHRLGSRTGETHEFGAGHQFRDPPGQGHVVFRLARADDPQVQGLGDSGLDAGVVVAQQGGAVRHAHVDVLAPLHIVETRAVTARHVQRMADGRIGAGRGGHTARQVPLGLLVQLVERRQGLLSVAPAGQPAVGDDRGAGQERTLVGGQEEGHVGDFFGLGDAPRA